MVSIRYYGTHRCGGSVISENHVLTSAYCFAHPDHLTRYAILAGSTSRFGSESQQYEYIEKLFVHPKYVEIENDIAVVKIVGSFHFNYHVRAIQLPNQGEIAAQGAVAKLSGWGRKHNGLSPYTTNIHSVNVTVFDHEKCHTLYPGSYRSSMLCAGQVEGGRDACVGDEGTPLVVKETLIGMPTRHIACGSKFKPTLYTSVSHFVDWVKSIQNE